MPVCRSSSKALLIAIVAPQQFLLDQPVLFGRQRSRQASVVARDIVRADQTGKSGNPFGPGQFFQNAAQTDDVVGISHFGQRRLMRAQQGEPVQDVRVAAELPERAHARVLGVEIVQKVAPGALIIMRRVCSERSGERLSGSLEQGRHRIAWNRESGSHD